MGREVLHLAGVLQRGPRKLTGCPLPLAQPSSKAGTPYAMSLLSTWTPGCGWEAWPGQGGLGTPRSRRGTRRRRATPNVCWPDFLPALFSPVLPVHLPGFPHPLFPVPHLHLPGLSSRFILCGSHLGLTVPKHLSEAARVPYLHSG